MSMKTFSTRNITSLRLFFEFPKIKLIWKESTTNDENSANNEILINSYFAQNHFFEWDDLT